MSEIHQTTPGAVSVHRRPVTSRLPTGEFDRRGAHVGSETPGVRREAHTTPEHIVVEADEITLRVGNAVIKLTKENGGTLEIHAANVRIHGNSILSQATQTNSMVGEHVIAEAEMHADLLGKLIRIDGQCVKINS
jgi:hypothetical protein